jgi:hypothetical protein
LFPSAPLIARAVPENKRRKPEGADVTKGEGREEKLLEEVEK